jgi:hypothetical protein
MGPFNPLVLRDSPSVKISFECCLENLLDLLMQGGMIVFEAEDIAILDDA